MQRNNSTPLLSSEIQLKLALAMVILGFEERVARATQELLDLEQAIRRLHKQQEELQEQRKKDIDYLERSVKQLYPDVSLTVSEGGQVEIPAGVLMQLQQLQQEHHQFLPEPAVISLEEPKSDEHSPEVGREEVSRTTGAFSLTETASAQHEESDIDPRAKVVFTYIFAQPASLVLDWRTTVQHALNLSDPPRIKGHATFKALQSAYRMLESMHDGTVSHPSASLTQFYMQHFIQDERWAELKDLMLEWGVTST